MRLTVNWRCTSLCCTSWLRCIEVKNNGVKYLVSWPKGLSYALTLGTHPCFLRVHSVARATHANIPVQLGRWSTGT